MEIITSTNKFSQTVMDIKATHIKGTGAPLGQQISDAAHEKNAIKIAENSREILQKQLNESILESNLNASVNAGNESMSLLYKAAIEGINDALKTDFGDNAIQNSYDSEIDVSPEATADRIVSMSTAFFSSFREQNLNLSDEEALIKFAEIIESGIDKGFADARDVLTGLNVLQGDIASNIDATYNLVQDGLQAFIDSYVQVDEESVV